MDDVAQYTSANPYAIGLIGYPFLQQLESLRSVDIQTDSGHLVMLSLDTIKNGSYPLTHPIFVYILPKTIQNNPAMGELLACYLNISHDKILDASFFPASKEQFDEAVAIIDPDKLDHMLRY